MYRIQFFIGFLFLATVLQSQAIDSQLNNSLDKEWSIELPIWIPGFRGDFSFGDVSLEGEDGGTTDPPTPEHPIEPGDGLGGNVFSRLFNKDFFLKFFYMSKISYTPNRFLFQIDGFGGSAGNGISFNYNNKEIVSATYSFIILHFYAGWSIFQKIDYKAQTKANIYLYSGLEYITTKVNSELNRGEIKFKISPDWVEVLFGINAQYTVEDWKFDVRGDIGGLTPKSTTFSYKIQFLVYYSLSNSISLRIGWTDLSIKYDRIFANERLILDTHLSGPNLGIAFAF